MSPSWDGLVAEFGLEDFLKRRVPAEARQSRPQTFCLKGLAVFFVTFLVSWTCNFGQGSGSLILIGQTGSGKSTLGNALVCGKPNKGPFTVGTSMTSETKHMTTVFSDKLNLSVTDTPGLFDYRAGASKEELKNVSNKHMGSLTHFLRENGGRIVWLISDCARITSQMRATMRALALCNPNWPLHTMVVSKTYSPAKFEDLGGDVQEERPSLDEKSAREAAATRYDAQQLGELNSALRAEGVSFFHFTTYAVGSEAFGMARMVERVRNFVLETLPLPPYTFMSWEDLLGSVKKRQEEKEMAEEDLLNGQILPLLGQVEYYRACANKHRDARIHEHEQWSILGRIFLGGSYQRLLGTYESMAQQEDIHADIKHQVIEQMRKVAHQKKSMIAGEFAHEIQRISDMVSDNL